ncbi:NB-ARC domains-containing protein [Artemisia annua]|uniref:NB-ARC domains-containing protein n=1 Tax=Artemisia annua TaxID=35608 RepID=A0A2U1KX22_ARTAN|nr:NB-ARC domains-containing protein [Artemisia annua]
MGKAVRKQAQEKYHHISFVSEEYETYKKFRVLEGATSLRTFLAVRVKEDLRLVNYRCLEFPNWVGDTSFLKLTRVTMHGSKKCASLPPLGQLLSLKELYIQGMEDAKVVGGFGVSWELSCISDGRCGRPNSRSGAGDAVFPCLQVLLIEGCPKVVEVSLEAPLPPLRDLKISSCVAMDLNAVEELEVRSCDKLRYLLEPKEAEASSKVLVS